MSSSNSSARSSRPLRRARPRVAAAPDRQRVVVGDEAERLRARAVEAARQQHAERLVREPAFERIGDEIVALAARKGLDQHLVGAGDDGALCCSASHSATGSGSARHDLRIGQHGAHALGEMRRQAGTCRRRSSGSSGSRSLARETKASVSLHAFEAQRPRRRTRRCRRAAAAR